MSSGSFHFFPGCPFFNVIATFRLACHAEIFSLPRLHTIQEAEPYYIGLLDHDPKKIRMLLHGDM